MRDDHFDRISVEKDRRDIRKSSRDQIRSSGFQLSNFTKKLRSLSLRREPNAFTSILSALYELLVLRSTQCENVTDRRSFGITRLLSTAASICATSVEPQRDM